MLPSLLLEKYVKKEKGETIITQQLVIMAYYRGEIHNSTFHGTGELVQFLEMGKPNQIIKEVYQGHFVYGKKQGQGILHQTHRGTFKGKFYKNKLVVGFGEFTDLKGNVYVGDIKDYELTGQGVLTSSDGTKEIGQFLNGCLHGHGCVELKDGSRGPVCEFVFGTFKCVLKEGATNNIYVV